VKLKNKEIENKNDKDLLELIQIRKQFDLEK
jgi:hypothetical protein